MTERRYDSTERPLVSILIPVFNREELIGRCVGSAVAQTYRNIEVVVCDNASSDRTRDVVRSFAEKDPRVRLFENSSNLGPTRNWLRCLELSRGEYIVFLWSDDFLLPGFLTELVPLLSHHENAGFAYCPAILQSAATGEKTILYTPAKGGLFPSSAYIQDSLLRANSNMPVSPACALFRKSDAICNLEPYIPNSLSDDSRAHGIGPDLLLFLKTANEYSHIAVTTKPLVVFWSHDSSITVSSDIAYLFFRYDLARLYFSSVHQKSLICAFISELFIHKLRFLRSSDYYNFRLWRLYRNMGCSRFHIAKIFVRIVRILASRIIRRPHRSDRASVGEPTR